MLFVFHLRDNNQRLDLRVIRSDAANDSIRCISSHFTALIQAVKLLIFYIHQYDFIRLGIFLTLPTKSTTDASRA